MKSVDLPSRNKIIREIRRAWPVRKASAHKGDFGRIFILAGSYGFTGAAHLAGMGAAKSGGGLVTIGVPKRVYEIIARKEAEVMVRPFPSTPQGSLSYRALPEILRFLEKQDVLAAGPGLSRSPATQRLIRALTAKSRQRLVLDADGLNAFEGFTPGLRQAAGRAVLTPHPGEFVRLFGKPAPKEDDSRIRRALDASKKSGTVVVLKGRHTVTACPDGDFFLNPTGNPGMATGGTGDVLTGVIAALAGQGLSLKNAARFGVFIHGMAGDLAADRAGRLSMTATDLLDALPAAFKSVLRQ